MNVAIFVQARMGSSRLAGKVLKKVLGRPLLSYQIERLRKVKNADQIVVLTTTRFEDDLINKLCLDENIACFRGSEHDVLNRYYEAAQLFKPSAIVRSTADCPLIDPKITEEVISLFLNNQPKCDYASNSLERTFPRGLDVEIISLNALTQAERMATQSFEREHVTAYIYKHPEQFILKNLALNPSQAKHRWTVDTPEDFELIKRIIETLYPKDPDFDMQSILNLLKNHPDWFQLNAHIEQKKI